MAKKTYPATPELDKVRAVKARSQEIGSFIDWLEEQSVVLCVVTDSKNHPFERHYESHERILARYFEIDLNKVDDERRAILDYMNCTATQNDK